MLYRPLYLPLYLPKPTPKRIHILTTRSAASLENKRLNSFPNPRMALTHVTLIRNTAQGVHTALGNEHRTVPSATIMKGTSTDAPISERQPTMLELFVNTG